MQDDDAASLVRYWFEFDVADLAPAKREGWIQLDGGTLAYRVCGRGVGVTGYNEADCLALIESVLDDEPLPPVARVVREVDVDSLGVDKRHIGVTVWRGVWHPPLNRDGSVIG